MSQRTLDDIIADFSFIDDWEDRYRYVMELGKELDELPEALRNADHKVKGCASQVWLVTNIQKNEAGSATLSFIGDSDSALVRGLIAILLSTYSGKSAQDILSINASEILTKLDLQDHITPQRSNGFSAMAARIHHDAKQALEG